MTIVEEVRKNHTHRSFTNLYKYMKTMYYEIVPLKKIYLGVVLHTCLPELIKLPMQSRAG